MDFKQDKEAVMTQLSKISKNLLLKPKAPAKRVNLLSRPSEPRAGRTTLQQFKRNEADYFDNDLAFEGDKLRGKIINVNDELRNNNNSAQFITNYRMHKGRVTSLQADQENCELAAHRRSPGRGSQAAVPTRPEQERSAGPQHAVGSTGLSLHNLPAERNWPLDDRLRGHY